MEEHNKKHCPPLWKRHRWLKWLFPVTGLMALVWFLVRVIPKPSRATYPCQRVAFPLASGFIVWLTGASVSLAAFRKAKLYFTRSRWLIGALCVAVSVGAAFFAMSGGLEKMTLGADPNPNEPIGTASGIYPGRVVWVWDPNATDWEGATDVARWYDNSSTNPAICESMFDEAILNLTGQTTVAAAWDAMFKYYNNSVGKGNVGYSAGEKVNIKLNLVNFHRATNLDTSGNQNGSFECYHNAIQMVLPMVRQLVNVVGVNDADIYIGSTIDGVPNHIFEPVKAEFPDVHFTDYVGMTGREQAVKSETDFIYWSDPNSSFSEGIPTYYAACEYLINFAVLKAHASNGITVCAKNHYGSFCRTPMNWWHDWPGGNAYLDLHNFMPDRVPGMGHYRPIVDLLGHPKIDGNTVLWLIDGLYSAPKESGNIVTWQMAPFNNDNPSSLFVSLDPLAIDSVAYDFMYNEWDPVNDPESYPHYDGADDYLHEAALAPDPPSGAFYDPDGDAVEMTSLGVHEHWNNAADKQYTRNLGTGNGIELVKVVHDLGYIDDVADSDIIVKGTVTGTYKATQTSNDNYESIQEILSGGSPSKRYSYLEHKWRIDVTGGTSVTFYVEAHKTASTDGDNFVFAYSTSVDGTYTDMITVTKTADDDIAQSFVLPGSTSGYIYIRVRDTNRTAGNTALDTIYIDDMYVTSVHGGGAPDTTPPSPNPMTWATVPYATGSTSIAMVATTATDTSGVEYYFDETSGNPGGTDSGWQSGTSYTDTGLSPSTQYCYRVQARDLSPNQNATAWSTTQCATTQSGGTLDMFVNDITMSSYSPKSNYYAARATVWIKDQNTANVSGAAVTGSWSGATTGSSSGNTGADGKVTLESKSVKGGGTFTFTVTNVSATGYTYNPSLNVETSDSITAP
jgi:hypothetical protein